MEFPLRVPFWAWDQSPRLGLVGWGKVQLDSARTAEVGEPAQVRRQLTFSAWRPLRRRASLAPALENSRPVSRRTHATTRSSGASR